MSETGTEIVNFRTLKEVLTQKPPGRSRVNTRQYINGSADIGARAAAMGKLVGIDGLDLPTNV